MRNARRILVPLVPLLALLVASSGLPTAVAAASASAHATASAAAPAQGTAAAPALTATTLVADLTIPWDLVFTPDGAMLWTERPGAFGVRLANGTTRTLAADLGDLLAAGEMGLMGMTLDPDFAANRRLVTCQGHLGGTVHVVVWQVDAGYTTLTRVTDPLLSIESGTRHAGCRVRFGPEGALWIATGDAAVGTHPQNLATGAGKVLRVDPTTGAGWPGNPFAASANAMTRRIFSYGHRNLQGLAQRPCTDQMWTAEHGPDRDDEINLLRRGGNAGWNPVPGYNEGVPMTDLAAYPDAMRARWSSGFPTIATSGIDWVRGPQWGDLDGMLAVAALKGSSLRFVRFDHRGRQVGPMLVGLTGFGRLRTPVQGPDGALYVTTANGGGTDRILRVTLADPPEVTDATSSDLDGDGIDDLAVGVPGEGAGTRPAGGVHLFAGSAEGPGSPDTVVPLAAGRSVAVGDANGDGLADIVAGNPRTDGAFLICGRVGGLDGSGGAGVLARADQRYRGGGVVAFGDFDADGDDDLVLGAPSRAHRGSADAGAVFVVPGSPAGPRTAAARGLLQGRPETGDRFGAAVATGDLDGDGYDDLAVGAPGETIGAAPGAGAVSVFWGGPDGLRVTRRTDLAQAGSVEAGDAFGASVDITTLGLLVGAPGEALGQARRAGVITVATVVDDRGFSQEHRHVGHFVPGLDPAPGDRFGAAVLGAGTRAGQDDTLVVSAPGFRRGRGLVVTGPGAAQVLVEPGSRDPGDGFGTTLRAGDWNGDGRIDLAVGVPGNDAARGSVEVFARTRTRGLRPWVTLRQGAPFADAATPGDAFGW